MSLAVQISLMAAAISVIGLVLFLIPLVLQVRRYIEHLERTTDQLPGKLEVLLQDSHEALGKFNALTTKADGEMADVGRIIDSVKQLTDRGNRLAQDIGTIFDPPVVALARNFRVLRKGGSAFINALVNGSGKK